MSELQEVLRAIEECRERGGRMALATVIGVEGSTYRRPGARLLIPEDGKPVGTISGGCLEGDVREAATGVIRDGSPALLHFDLTADDEAVWGWGLGCNGIVDVYVEPAEGALQAAQALHWVLDERRDLAMVTVIAAEASAGVETGARIVVHPSGEIEGSLGDPAIDLTGREEALHALRDDRSVAVPLSEGVRAFVEVLRPPVRVVVCGAGHDAVPLVRFAALLGWRIEVVDDREAFLKPARFAGAAGLVWTEPIDAAGAVSADDRTHVVVMSHNFLRDKDYLRSFLGSEVPYIGMLGPGARLERILDELQREGFEPSPARLGAVRGPAGLDLGAEGPEEVAWSILAEILAVRNGRAGGSLRDRTGPIHDAAPGSRSPATASG